jgi:hypothetical protein
VLDILVHWNFRQSNVTVSDVSDSGHLPILFHILDHISTYISAPVEFHIDWERFRSLTSDLISPMIKIDTVNETEFAISETLQPQLIGCRDEKSPFRN